MASNSESGRHTEILISPDFDNDELTNLFNESWPEGTLRDFSITHQHSLAYLIASEDKKIIGYLNIPHDGAYHAFIVDLTVHPNFRRRGVALLLLDHAVTVCRNKKYHWAHLDFKEELSPLYEKAGFQLSTAGLLNLN